VELVDVAPERAATAAALGVRFSEPARAQREADLVIHASGAPAGLVTALSLAGTEANIIEMSWFGASPVTLPLGEAFHARRLTVRSSQVGSLPLIRRGRWDHRRRLALALSLLADPVLDLLIDGELLFDDLPTALPQLADRPALCHRVRYLSQ
jgi:threonine dehydrogenase-like Zn-dependent dehydrogenase